MFFGCLAGNHYHLLSTREVGQKGENIASKYLLDHGFQIIDRNWKIDFGEIDIVAIKSDCTYFVEVKTQYASQKTRPEDELTRNKISKLKCLADLYAKYHADTPQKLSVAAVCVTLIDKENWHVKFYENLLE